MSLKRSATVVALIFASCGSGNQGNGQPDLSATSGGMVTGHARILHGPSTTTMPQPSRRRGSHSLPHPLVADGRWAISPDQAKVTVVSLSFQGEQQDQVQAVMLSSCVPTYMIGQPALTELLDCPFQIPAGNYVAMGIGVSTTFQVLVNDTTDGLFTDPSSATQLSMTAPASGAQFVSFSVAGPGGSGNVLSQETYFSHPIAVSSTGVGSSDGGEPGLIVDIAEDMIHTLFVNVSGGAASFDTSLPLPAVQMMASIDGAGGVAFYTSTGSAGNVMLGGPTDDDSQSVRLFYDGSGEASYLFHPVVGPSQAWNANPANSPMSGTSRAGGYLGIDATGTLCWAVPTDGSYQTYNAICAMKVLSTLGTTTTLNCMSTTTAPAPTSGDTYASGCPSITPTTTETLTLVAY